MTVLQRVAAAWNRFLFTERDARPIALSASRSGS
jgi:hypothetical protein